MTGTSVVQHIYRLERRGRAVYAFGTGPSHGPDEEWRLVEGDLFGDYEPGEVIDPRDARILAPCRPSKIVAVGLNYRDHALEMKKPLPDEPMIFIKPSTAVIGPQDAIEIPPGVGRVDYEAELGVVIRKRARRVQVSDASDFILGLTCINDVTARDLQAHDVQFTRAKGFDTFAPLGPCIAVGLDGGSLNVASQVNGQPRQSSNTRELIFNLEHLVAFISSVMTLLPGDVIATGTPSGIGPIAAGEQVVVSIEGIGELANHVVGDSSTQGGLAS